MKRLLRSSHTFGRIFQIKNQNLDVGSSRVSRVATILLGVSSLITFIVFITLDPKHNLLLSTCVAANFGIILWAIYRLYEWNLLLSPMSLVVVGPSMILYYSWGNLGARIVGEGRFGSNPGSLAFYPKVAFLSTLGLTLFCWIVFRVFSKQIRKIRIHYENLYWKPWQALVGNCIAILIVTYLSRTFDFFSGYFIGVESNFDKWLMASYYFFIVLAVVISTSVSVREARLGGKVIGIICLIIPILIGLGSRSRTFAIGLILIIVMCWVTLKPRRVLPILLFGGFFVVILFYLGTFIKTSNIEEKTSSIFGNLATVKETHNERIREINRQSGSTDFEYRLAGFELPAALMMSLEHGVPPMSGLGLYEGCLAALPNFARPEGEFSERLAIFSHFVGRGLWYADSIGLPLSSGIADWGIILGPLIYGILALFVIAEWRLAQISPRLFLAYLIVQVRVDPLDLFWEDCLYDVRAIGFAWLALFILWPVLRPRWTRPSDKTKRVGYQEPNNSVLYRKDSPMIRYLRGNS